MRLRNLDVWLVELEPPPPPRRVFRVERGFKTIRTKY